MDELSVFSVDHAAARQLFGQAAERLGWALESHAIDATGPSGEELFLDVAVSKGGDPARTLVVSSGLHGVEGFFGSAVQVALLQRWAAGSEPPARCVFLHGLNPFGFAWLRRFDQRGVDPNRNFLLPGEQFSGAPPGYAQLDSFLNPRRPPARAEFFTAQALWLIARHGMPALRQAIAAGQYEFPQGLFFGGREPCQIQQILAAHLPRWLAGADSIMHLDFHTGLGRWGTYKLLIDYPLSAAQSARLAAWFGEASFEACDASDIAYDARGGFGRWCVAQQLAAEYLFACAEFGTYSPLRVLAGLRAENQAHHWGQPTSASTGRSKRQLRELFCPASPAWRRQVLRSSQGLADRALRGLSGMDAPGS